ncbi:hypothetical protein BaRGS_00039784 [Batillaria attramentaria]|uniref:Uncharacterized protein n=1 Tax=Batillaria attramentaria TaxID=370345 RepID=A0ABD0J1Z7_9CAEN
MRPLWHPDHPNLVTTFSAAHSNLLTYNHWAIVVDPSPTALFTARTDLRVAGSQHGAHYSRECGPDHILTNHRPFFMS